MQALAPTQMTARARATVFHSNTIHYFLGHSVTDCSSIQWHLLATQIAKQRIFKKEVYFLQAKNSYNYYRQQNWILQRYQEHMQPISAPQVLVNSIYI